MLVFVKKSIRNRSFTENIRILLVLNQLILFRLLNCSDLYIKPDRLRTPLLKYSILRAKVYLVQTTHVSCLLLAYGGQCPIVPAPSQSGITK